MNSQNCKTAMLESKSRTGAHFLAEAIVFCKDVNWSASQLFFMSLYDNTKKKMAVEQTS